MDEETRERCFEPLFTTKGPFKGTGMGLAAARRLVEESHGAIVCRSQARSRHDLRDHLSDGRPTTVDERSQFVVPERPRGSATILIVDDDEELRRFMSRILERNGYRVAEADSAEARAARRRRVRRHVRSSGE